MNYKSRHSNRRSNKKAIAWALFSQSIWIPALLTDTHDQISTKTNDYDFSGVAANIPNQNLPEEILRPRYPATNTNSLIASSSSRYASNGVVLNTILPKDRDMEKKISVNAPSVPSVAFSAPSKHRSIEVAMNTSIQLKKRQQSQIINAPRSSATSSDLLRRLYSLSDLLGGSLSLRDINEPLMPPVARAERAQVSRSGDPLATIPQMWREPMRKALKNLSDSLKTTTVEGQNNGASLIAVDQARVIHVPSSRVKRFSEVPLALQSDGTVDILNSPDDPEVVEEIRTWSSKQQLPEKGRMAPAVVQLHPLPPQQKSPVSENLTQSNSSSPSEDVKTVQPTQAETSEVQNTSTPPSLSAIPPAPTPPPPVTESHTTSHLPVEVEPTIPEPTPEISSAAVSLGEVQ